MLRPIKRGNNGVRIDSAFTFNQTIGGGDLAADNGGKESECSLGDDAARDVFKFSCFDTNQPATCESLARARVQQMARVASQH